MPLLYLPVNKARLLIILYNYSKWFYHKIRNNLWLTSYILRLWLSVFQVDITPLDIIIPTLNYCLAYKLSYREVEEMFAQRNIHFDHSTLNRWLIKYAPQLEAIFRKMKRRVAGSWRMDETYIKVKGR